MAKSWGSYTLLALGQNGLFVVAEDRLGVKKRNDQFAKGKSDAEDKRVRAVW